MTVNWIANFFTEVKLTDVLIALFTGLLWWSTDKLWRETKKLAEGAEDRTKKMSDSIAQAARSAEAIGKIAISSSIIIIDSPR